MLFVTLVSTCFVITATATNFRQPNMTVSNATFNSINELYYVSVGQTVTITCTVTSSAYNASRLVLVLSDTVMTARVNDVSIQVNVTTQTPRQDFFRCCVDNCPPVWMFDPGVNGVTIKFEYQTLVADSFTCVSPDYNYVNCFWLVPNTTDQLVWNMTYCIEGYLPEDLSYLSCRSRDEPYHITCESHATASTISNTNGAVYSCALDHFYKTQTYRINVTGDGDFSRATGGGRVRAGVNIVQYSPVKNISLSGPLSSTTLSLHWSKPIAIHGALPQFRLIVRRLATTGTEYVATYTTNRTRYTLTGLIPGSSYKVQIEAKPEQSPYWSSPSNITVTTNETGISTTPYKQKTGAIVGVSTLLSVIVFIIISCIVYHRRRLFRLDKIPIETPRMIQTVTNIPPTPPSGQFSYQSLTGCHIHPHIDQSVRSESVSDTIEHCSGSSQESRSIVNINSDVASSDSVIHKQDVTSLGIASKSTSSSKPSLDASPYVTVAGGANQEVIIARDVHNDYIPHPRAPGSLCTSYGDVGSCEGVHGNSPLNQRGTNSVSVKSGIEGHGGHITTQETDTGSNAYAMETPLVETNANKEDTCKRAVHVFKKDDLIKTNSSDTPPLNSDYIRIS